MTIYIEWILQSVYKSICRQFSVWISIKCIVLLHSVMHNSMYNIQMEKCKGDNLDEVYSQNEILSFSLLSKLDSISVCCFLWNFKKKKNMVIKSNYCAAKDAVRCTNWHTFLIFLNCAKYIILQKNLWSSMCLTCCDNRDI